MSQRLYHSDAYLTDFEATVLGRDDSAHRLYLDQTAFYPTSGGQQFDLGALTFGDGKRLAVLDVVDEGERIAHVVSPDAAALPEAGSRLVGHIDWPRRFDHMQQHTGQHLLSALFQESLGFGTVSVHFGIDSSTLDLDTPAITPEQVEAIETAANARIVENRPITAQVEDAESATGLRKASTRSGALRIISIEGLDRSACGGTHVRSTAEIGSILIRKIERVRKTVRVEFVCGGRATRRARADYVTLTRLAGLLSTGIDGLPDVLTSRLSELKGQASELRDARERLGQYRARELYDGASLSGERRVSIERQATGSLQDLRGLAQAYVARPRAVLIGVLDSPPSLLVAASADSGADAGALLKSALALHGGRGGGSPRMAQGSVETSNALEALLGFLRAELGA
jgi:alanyl-tRNA synthetase